MDPSLVTRIFPAVKKASKSFCFDWNRHHGPFSRSMSGPPTDSAAEVSLNVALRSGVVFASVLQFFVNHGQHVRDLDLTCGCLIY